MECDIHIAQCTSTDTVTWNVTLQDIHSQCLPIRVQYSSLLRLLVGFVHTTTPKAGIGLQTGNKSVVALLQSIACRGFRTCSANADFSMSPVKTAFWCSFGLTPNNLFVQSLHGMQYTTLLRDSFVQRPLVLLTTSIV